MGLHAHCLLRHVFTVLGMCATRCVHWRVVTASSALWCTVDWVCDGVPRYFCTMWMHSACCTSTWCSTWRGRPTSKEVFACNESLAMFFSNCCCCCSEGRTHGESCVFDDQTAQLQSAVLDLTGEDQSAMTAQKRQYRCGWTCPSS
jgi:hypothetical protein